MLGVDMKIEMVMFHTRHKTHQSFSCGLFIAYTSSSFAATAMISAAIDGFLPGSSPVKFIKDGGDAEE